MKKEGGFTNKYQGYERAWWVSGTDAMRNEAAEIGPDCGKLLCELMLVYLT